MILCNSSLNARLITACAVIYGWPFVSILLSYFVVPYLEWFQLLESDVNNLYLVKKGVYARQNTRHNIFSQIVNVILFKDAAMEQFRKMLRIRRYYFGLPCRIDRVAKNGQSWRDDFRFYVLQNNMLFAMIFAHRVHPVSRQTNRAIFACSHAFGLLMYVWLGFGKDGTAGPSRGGGISNLILAFLIDDNDGNLMQYVWNYCVIIPVSMILRNVILYIYGCPCMYSAKKSFIVLCCIRVGSVIIMPLFLMSIYVTILVGRWADNSCLIMSYLYTNVIAVGLLDILKIVPHFCCWCKPFGLYIGGYELVRMGSWMLERHQEELFTIEMPCVEIEEDIVWKLGPLRFVRYDEFMGREVMRDVSVVV